MAAPDVGILASPTLNVTTAKTADVVPKLPKYYYGHVLFKKPRAGDAIEKPLRKEVLKLGAIISTDEKYLVHNEKESRYLFENNIQEPLSFSKLWHRGLSRGEWILH